MAKPKKNNYFSAPSEDENLEMISGEICFKAIEDAKEELSIELSVKRN